MTRNELITLIGTHVVDSINNVLKERFVGRKITMALSLTNFKELPESYKWLSSIEIETPFFYKFDGYDEDKRPKYKRQTLAEHFGWDTDKL